MALTTRHKKSSARSPRAHRVADMTTDELRVMIEQLIDRKLADSLAVRSSRHAISAQMKARALSAAGRFRSGHSDISKQHDDYLTTGYLQ